MNQSRAEHGENILLVEDDTELAAALSAVLTARGFAVRACDSVRAAQAALQECTPDLAVIDCELPDGNGLELVNLLRTRGSAAKILLVSAWWRGQPTVELPAELGVHQLLRKPFSTDEFAYRVRSLLAARPSIPSLPVQRTPSSKPPSTRSIDEQLEQLSNAYVAKLRGAIDELSANLVAARIDGVDSESFDTARRIAHKLHGTAGTYKLFGVSTAAGALEATLDSLDATKLKTAGAELDAGLERIRQAMAETKLSRHGFNSTPTAQGHAMARVLVVDDNPEFLAEVKRMAADKLVDVVTADSESAALGVAEGTLDAAIIDIHLAAEDSAGRLAMRLRSKPGNSNLPIAFCSADASLENQITAAHIGSSAFLSKPIDPDEFASTVRQLATSRQQQRAHVLLVDDDEDFIALVGAILRDEGMRVTTLTNPLRFMDVVAEARPDLILLDIVMPELSGYDLCKVLRSSPKWQSLPVVFLTAASDQNARLTCFQIGGDDYIEKPIIKEELLARIGVRLDRARLFYERAYIDSLTGLFTRQAFSDAVVKRLSEARRRTRPLSIALLDVDEFKQVNDTYGHTVGDRVLALLGRLIRGRFRTEDVRGRWGGEEFAIAFYEEETATTIMLMQRLLTEFRELTFSGDAGTVFNSSFSAGVAGFPGDGETLDELVRVADERLYAAKRAGRNRVL